MRLKHSAISDSRWHELVVTYQNNWVKAFRELFGKEPTPQQRLILDAAEGDGKCTTVSAGYGVGAHTAMAAIAILRVILYRQGRVVLVRPGPAANVTKMTLAYVEMHWRYALEQHPWLDMYFKLTDTYMKERTDEHWGMVIKSYRSTREESLAGEHGNHHLTIVLQASAASDKTFGIIRGGMTQEDNGLLLLSQPSRDEGFFYDSHHDLNKLNSQHGYFTALTLNAEDSPLVSSEYIEMKRQEYGGPDSNEYRQKVQGRFPLEETAA